VVAEELSGLPEQVVADLQRRFISNMPGWLGEILALFSGKAWLIGSTIPLVIEGLPHDRDYDFLVEEVPELSGWTARTNSYGNPKFCRGTVEIDVVPLRNVYTIQSSGRGIPGGMAATIENYLTGTPLTHQSVAYDVQAKQLVGDTGLHAIHTRTALPNDVIQFCYYCHKKGKRPNQLLQEHAQRLGYTTLEVHEGFIDVFLPPSSSHPRS
jgi:hypothetical protein